MGHNIKLRDKIFVELRNQTKDEIILEKNMSKQILMGLEKATKLNYSEAIERKRI